MGNSPSSRSGVGAHDGDWIPGPTDGLMCLFSWVSERKITSSTTPNFLSYEDGGEGLGDDALRGEIGTGEFGEPPWFGVSGGGRELTTGALQSSVDGRSLAEPLDAGEGPWCGGLSTGSLEVEAAGSSLEGLPRGLGGGCPEVGEATLRSSLSGLCFTRRPLPRLALLKATDAGLFCKGRCCGASASALLR